MIKRNVMVRAFVMVGLLLALALSTSPAMGASDKLNLKKMKVSIQPEYDDPRVMVTYQGEFKDAAFPQAVAFPVPLGSEMNMVCALKPPNDEHLCQLYETSTVSDALSVSYTLPIPTYYLEYYWDGIKGQPDKSFAYKYVSPYAIDSLELEVQQPLKATDFKLSQQYASSASDSQGFKYYRYVFNNVTPGQVISVDGSYTKADNKPSVAKKQTNAAGSTSSGSGNSSNTYAIMGVGAALLTLAGFGYMLLRRRPAPVPVRTVPAAQSRKAARVEARRIAAHQAQRQQVSRPAHPEPARAAPPTSPQLQGSGFCSQCGARLAAGSRFCHVCGAKAKGVA